MFLSFMISVPFSACFEAPFLQIEKLILFPERKKKEAKEIEKLDDSRQGLIKDKERINRSEVNESTFSQSKFKA